MVRSHLYILTSYFLYEFFPQNSHFDIDMDLDRFHWSLAIAPTVCVLILFIVKRLLAGTQRRPYPPGPKGLPLLGYTKAIKSPNWVTYQEWGREYGTYRLLHRAHTGDLIREGHRFRHHTLQHAWD